MISATADALWGVTLGSAFLGFAAGLTLSHFEAPAGLCWQVGSLVGFGTWFLTIAFVHRA